ncbi:hypothetical protein HBB16_21405 [Pseudonocardia sp. MCCB 268]|nr:hypothetical protein [Pseudonocardia cytotoxica]
MLTRLCLRLGGLLRRERAVDQDAVATTPPSERVADPRQARWPGPGVEQPRLTAVRHRPGTQ